MKKIGKPYMVGRKLGKVEHEFVRKECVCVYVCECE